MLLSNVRGGQRGRVGQGWHGGGREAEAEESCGANPATEGSKSTKEQGVWKARGWCRPTREENPAWSHFSN